MPLYEYQCQQCGWIFERIQRFSDPPLTTCEQCSGLLKRLISPPAIQFKGSGWYVTDYGNKSAGDTKGKTEGPPAERDKKESVSSAPKAQPASED